MALESFFSPKAVAVVGASRNPAKVGHVVFRNFLEGGFQGKVYAVNPNAESLFGHPCFKSIADIPEKVDLAVLCVPAAMVPKAIEECGKKRIFAAIVLAGGFREVGNSKGEEALVAAAKRWRVRVIGPNCLGVFDPASGVDTVFLPRYKLERPGLGSIAFISQSGAVGSVVMDWMAMKGYRISKFISYGNASDVDETELLEVLAADEQTKVICCYFEGLKGGRAFYEAAKRVSAKKPIVVLKGGVTAAGSTAALSHTGSLAGETAVYSAAFKQAGIIEARDIEQLFDYARVLATQPAPRGSRVQVITNGGGFGILLTDWLSTVGLPMAEMKPEGIAKLKAQLPDYVVLKNPMDLVGDVDAERYRIAVSAALADPGVDMLAVIVLLQTPALTADVVEVIAEEAEKRSKPLIVISAGGRYTEVLKKSLEDMGIPTFSYPERAAEALKALLAKKK